MANSIDESMGFARYDSGKKRVGWLCNMHSTTVADDKIPGGRAGVDFYFIEDDGGTFKATLEYEPYFLIAVKRGSEAEVEEWTRRKFEGLLKGVRRVEREDLQMPNHLLGYRRVFLQLRFINVPDLLAVRKSLMPLAEKNKKQMTAMDTYAEVANANMALDIYDDSRGDGRPGRVLDASDSIVDIREYDVPYHVRVAIDKGIRIGKWYTVEAKHGAISLKCIEERLQRAEPVVLAYDIETTKLPLKFPDSLIDQIMMVSYMIDGQGFLITNREIVSEDIADFEYTPRQEYEGPFMVFNEPDERALLERFLGHIKEAKPTVIATYNGDFFDWPFVEARASMNGIDMYREIGFQKNSEDVYESDYCTHMDCFSWVKRDSYLPQGSQGLKAVTVAKLGYDPDELDPELMTRYASERPQTLAEYSVSDAVATYYLYMKYVHPFVFSLCTIIPLNPDAVLRKGTGTLCEMLLMVQAYSKEIVLPNKHQAPTEAFWDGHLLESETYVGGHVESIEAGVFRSDIPVSFNIDTEAIDELIRDLDAALQFSIVIEGKQTVDDVTNYDEVKEQIQAKLLELKAVPGRHEKPSIYHLDVASMYPNIMTTNRLQPDSMIQESDCAVCDFNRPGKTCDRRMPWSWRGEFLPAKRDEYNMIRRSLENEHFPGRRPGTPSLKFQDLNVDEQASLVKKRLQEYSKKIYHKIHETQTIEREAIICQRENPFYVDTVKNFRDRRYDFKGRQKVWKNKVESLKGSGATATEIEEAKKMIVLFDSLQLAHKVILNSFYGYVMRKGSRWYSMEMAGVTCLTGAHIIQMARQLVERIGRPLELDTDGIWCILPATFPENFAFALKGGKKLPVSYPCVMLNHLVHDKFTNDQYQELVGPATFKYATHSENTIFFEVDGPYRAMILPTSKEEDKNLKKRYAVFNDDGTLAELKGFEVKRRGELKLIKIFQQQIFKFFLEGSTLNETYEAVAKVANRWLDVLYQHGSTLADEELIDLICENRSMSKTLEEYGAQKSTSITTAKRLAEFLGDQMTKDKGLNCKYIISSKPKAAPVTERAIPVAIFSADENVKRFFLRKWIRDDPSDMDPRTLIDWNYYIERLGSVVQKLVTIPAALQKISNPVPRVAHPDWLQRRINVRDDKLKQNKLTDHFEKKTLADITNVVNHSTQDLEDFGSSPAMKLARSKGSTTRMAQKRKELHPCVVEKENPFAALPAVMPPVSQDYPSWLKYQKKKWRIQKHARARRNHLFGEDHSVGSDAIASVLRNQAELLYTSTWQVLQVRSTGKRGELQAFVLIDRKIHSMKVKVPRQLFVNLKGPEPLKVSLDDYRVEKVKHTLPNGRPSSHLFRMTMPERSFLRDRIKLDAAFNDPNVDGVYERQVPLEMRAVLELGNLCTFDQKQKGVLGKGLDSGFDLSALHTIRSDHPYLSEVPMGYIFLYHIVSGERQIFALLPTTRDEATIVILSRARDNQGLPNIDKVYLELLGRKQQETGAGDAHRSFLHQDSIRFNSVHVTTKRKAHLVVGDVIKKLRAEESAPLMMVVQSARRRLLSQELPVLNEFPMLHLRSEQSDGNLPPLGWQSAAARRIVARYLSLDSWIGHLLQLARFGGVPLCNLERDDPSFIIDVAYARRLQQNNVVLWWSSSARPDHGGHEHDDVAGSLDSVEMPSINSPGAYPSVCIELQVRNLAINTVLTSALVNELEGSDSDLVGSSGMAGDGSGEGTNMAIADQTSFASTGIVVLRDMVKAWWAEACQGSSAADMMVQHLVRWISSADSFLYDRSLHRYVQTLSRKALQQLMADFRRFGSNVVYASSTRLLVQTTKTEVGNAYAYSQYILKTLRSKPLFHFLDLEIKEYWDYLLWYDAFNYGGKACQEVVEAESQKLDCVMHWQLSSFLPPMMQTIFHNWVVGYIELIHGLKGTQPTRSDEISVIRLTQLSAAELADESEGKTRLQTSYGKPLKKEMAALLRRQRKEMLHPELAGDYVFPSLPGSHMPLSNPALQLVKSLMQVLSLDKTTMLESRRLRKDLLAMFDVREFSSTAAFVNPSESLRIEQVVCDACTSTRDLDLCRDEDVIQEGDWQCLECGHEFNRLAIEAELISRVERARVEWSTQDLRCGKCARLCINDFMEHCPCSGDWVETVRRDELQRRLKVFDAVASAYGLKMLAEAVADLAGGRGL